MRHLRKVFMVVLVTGLLMASCTMPDSVENETELHSPDDGKVKEEPGDNQL